ncbi:MAG: hypothetical protein DMF79_04010 [Acidobacteria bacterium]|nr:MAG: hypothetical protein DMF79_04010 [Acidobacteriota bacterium]
MSYGWRWLRKSFAGSSRRPELRAHTVSPASHRVLMAMPPPAPVPTTITSKTFAAIPGLALSQTFGACRLRWPGSPGCGHPGDSP